MKKIGLVGGLGPASTVAYYLGLVEKCQAQYGTDVYPEIVIDSVNMSRHTEVLQKNDYDTLCELLLKSLNNLKNAGAQFAAITANMEHIVWDMVQERFPLPVISILDAVVEEIKKCGYQRVLVFGTDFTMKSGMYEKALHRNGITAILPDADDIDTIGRLIYPNLENGIVIPEDRQAMIALAEKYIAEQKADAMLLGCTEISLAIKPGDVSVPTLDTTKIHIEAIVRMTIACLNKSRKKT